MIPRSSRGKTKDSRQSTDYSDEVLEHSSDNDSTRQIIHRVEIGGAGVIIVVELQRNFLMGTVVHLW